ncbi:MAG TPA: aminodeoxychorismate/anthranilate synthase component II [Lactobacillaceae bacterium]|jgi:para-aminobenzoate synthetase component 2
MRILLIDNFDSFTYLLAQYLTELGATVDVVTENDAEMALNQAAVKTKYQAIVISPGPKTPADATFSQAIVRTYATELPILGVCLGHQVIAHVFGGEVVVGERPVHGKPAILTHAGTGLFAGLKPDLRVARYHSLQVKEISDAFVVDARSEDGVNQAMHHRTLPLYSVQFHPESFLTEQGHELLGNFLMMVKDFEAISTH